MKRAALIVFGVLAVGLVAALALRPRVTQDHEFPPGYLESLTAFEPEAKGHLIAGLDFHRFYFDLPHEDTPSSATMQSRWVTI